MQQERSKIILDFDGTLTNETEQAAELAKVSTQMLADEILKIPSEEVENIYNNEREKILKNPHLYLWKVNGMPATYAYEGAYLLNTVVLQQVLSSNSFFIKTIEKQFPPGELDSVTKCLNYLFHEGSLGVNPHFLDGARELLISLIKNELIDPVILTNSETRKINKNLTQLQIGEKGTRHQFEHEIEILGDTKQYFLDPNWDVYFDNQDYGKIQILPVTPLFSVDLRRPIYYEALSKIKSQGYKEIVVAADGFSLAGALPLNMGLHFILLKTDHTPEWSWNYVAAQPKGHVAKGMSDLGDKILSIVSG